MTCVLTFEELDERAKVRKETRQLFDNPSGPQVKRLLQTPSAGSNALNRSNLPRNNIDYNTWKRVLPKRQNFE